MAESMTTSEAQDKKLKCYNASASHQPRMTFRSAGTSAAKNLCPDLGQCTLLLAGSSGEKVGDVDLGRKEKEEDYGKRSSRTVSIVRNRHRIQRHYRDPDFVGSQIYAKTSRVSKYDMLRVTLCVTLGSSLNQVVVATLETEEMTDNRRGTSRNTVRKYIGASGRPARGSHAIHWTFEREEIHQGLRYFWHIFWTYKDSFMPNSLEFRAVQEKYDFRRQFHKFKILGVEPEQYYSEKLFEKLAEVLGDFGLWTDINERSAYNVKIISSKCRSDTERHQPKHQPVSWDNFKPFAFNQYPALFNDHIS
ncbi:hypothetical protein C8J56DRAFT_1072861 [Mycena floridula]|nr:hypothetical protein C8J56DRAFT_1072861 [Mycena floridula]